MSTLKFVSVRSYEDGDGASAIAIDTEGRIWILRRGVWELSMPKGIDT